jgi:hypothetical protein
MAIATWELHASTATRIHPAGRSELGAPGLRTSPARRPAPPNAPHARAATRGAVPAQVRRGLSMLALLVIAAVASVVLSSLGGATAAAELDALGIGGPLVGAERGALDDVQGDEIAVVIGPGETVWDLALPYLPAGVDAQVFMSRVLERNDVQATAVQPGTVIRIPLG